MWKWGIGILSCSNPWTAEEVTTCSTDSYLAQCVSQRVGHRDWEGAFADYETAVCIFVSQPRRADSLKYLILESGCLTSCTAVWQVVLRPPEFLHSLSNLRDWFACGVNLCKYLRRSHNRFMHTIQALWEITSQERHSGILFISENEYCTSLLILSLIWDVLLFLIAQHWEIFQTLSKLDASSMTRGRKSRLPQCVTPGNKGKLALTHERGYRKASRYFTAWKMTVKVDVKISSLCSIYIEMSFFDISRKAPNL